MSGVRWRRSGSTTWLTGPGDSRGAAVAGLTADAGYAAQDPRHLGVAQLVAAWLTREVARPVDGAGHHLQVVPSLGQSELTIALSGTPDAVETGLARLAAALGVIGDAQVDDDLRSRARMLANPLTPWSAHLAARWRGEPFVLSSLGPLALDGLGGAEMAAYAEQAFGPDARLSWTTDPALVPVAPAVGAAGRRLVLPAPRTGPAAVVRQGEGELATTLADHYDPAARVALSVLAAALHRRLVELEPLAADVRLRLHPLPGRTALVTCVLVGAQGRDDDVLAATLQTFEDLPGTGAAVLDRIRRGVAAETADVDEAEPATLAALARRQLVTGGEPTPHRLAEAVAATPDDAVRTSLATLHSTLLLAAPAAVVEPADRSGGGASATTTRAVTATGSAAGLPVVAAGERPAPTGRRHRSLAEAGVVAVVSDTRVGRVLETPRAWPPTRKRTTLASVDLADVVLRVDAGPQVTALVDADLASVQLVHPLHRRGDALRTEVHARTAAVPRIEQPEVPEVAARVAEVTRTVRRARVGRVLIAVVLALGSVAAVVAGVVTRPRTVDVEVAATATVRLDNGTTVALVGAPEQEEARLLSVHVRLCGGAPGPRNELEVVQFSLLDGGRFVTTPAAVSTGRPQLAEGEVTAGECADGWVAFPLPPARLGEPALRYLNAAGDRVVWRLS